MNDPLRAKLEEYKALPDDLNIRLVWIEGNPSPKADLRCTRCGRLYEAVQFTWADVEFAARKGRVLPTEMVGICPKCEPDEDTESDSGVSSTG